MKAINKPIICIDFDGVLHSYKSGWRGATIIPDKPNDGAINFLLDAVQYYDVHIISSRAHRDGGINAMKLWLTLCIAKHLNAQCTQMICSDGTVHQKPASCTMMTEKRAEEIVEQLTFPTYKPQAVLTLDDRAICFDGTFPSISEIANFKPWRNG